MESPHRFFFMRSVVFFVLIFVLGGVWVYRIATTEPEPISLPIVTEPLPNETSHLEAVIGEAFTKGGVTITVLDVIEDSRCPSDVVCVWQGTLKVRVLLESGLGSGEQVFELGQPITTEAEEVVLEEVLPVPNAGEEIPQSAYSFRFSVKARNSHIPVLEVPVQSRFDNKIVYTTDQSADVTLLREHCLQEGGIFNACGSPCASDEEMCIAVCAFTCDF